jgi:hypothetical protein
MARIRQLLAGGIQTVDPSGFEQFTQSSDSVGLVISDSLNVATASGNLTDSINTFRVRLMAIIEGTLEVVGEAIFRSPVSFFSDVFFKKAPTFSSDTAGIAVIPKYQTTVDVVFEQAYKEPPVISLQLTAESATMSAFLEEGKGVVVTNVTTTGFTIALPNPAFMDYEYNWIAIAVDNKRKTMGRRIDDSGYVFPQSSIVATPPPTQTTGEVVPTPITIDSGPPPTPTISSSSVNSLLESDVSSPEATSSSLILNPLMSQTTGLEF